MGDEKRWSVTYTKHLKHKRKVYQDGSLRLLSNNKVMLYDESEQLLDSKFLTKDEAVRSGESLAFTAFLVDIGDPETNGNTTSYPNPKSEQGNATPEKTGFTHGENLRNTFLRAKDRKPNTVRKKVSAINISPSQKIIRDFKKNELLKYGVQQSPSSPTTPSFREWEALYTKQITQKAKKYHDGFIRMVICGCMGRQIMLYDSYKNQLDKRFLKKDEVITAGESVMFDAYLVDIGDPTVTNEDYTDIKIYGINCKMTEKRETVAGRHNSFVGRQQQDACSGKRVDSNLCSLKVDKMKLGKILPSHMPLRDAHQILSILKKPVALDRAPKVEKIAGKQSLSQSSDMVQLDSVFQIERLVYTQGIQAKSSEDESLNKNEHTVGSAQNSRLQASADHVRSVVVQSSKVAYFKGSRSSVSTEAEAQHLQHCTAMPEADPKTKGQIASSDMSRTKCSAKDHGATGMSNSLKIEDLHKTLDCPSFDLGI